MFLFLKYFRPADVLLTRDGRTDSKVFESEKNNSNNRFSRKSHTTAARNTTIRQYFCDCRTRRKYNIDRVLDIFGNQLPISNVFSRSSSRRTIPCELVLPIRRTLRRHLLLRNTRVILYNNQSITYATKYTIIIICNRFVCVPLG